MPHLHVQAVAPGSGFRARSRASRGLLACVSGFSIENTPTSPGLRRLATGPVPVSPCGTLALRRPAGRDQARCRAEGGCGRGASGLDALGLHCCSEQPLPAERPAGAATSHQPWPACVPGAGRGREAPRGPGLGRGLDSRGARSVRSGSPPGWTSAARGRGAAVCGRRLPGGGSSLRVPPGKREGPPAWSRPQGDASWGPGSRRGPGLLPASLQGLVLGLSLPAGGMTPRL